MKSRILGFKARMGERARGLFGMRRAVSISLLLHVTLLLISGYIILLRYVQRAEVTFVGEPPRRPSLEPRKLEMKVQVQDLQKQSSRPRLQPRLSSASLAEIALPDIKINPQIVRQKVTPKVSTFGVSGFGTGIGGGLGDGSGGGFGTSQVNFFGLKGFGQRIAILLDVSESMCEDSRGYPKGYQRVKFRIREVISYLADGTFFNIISFARGCRTCFPKMLLADADSKERAKKWVEQFNNLEGPFGMRESNYWPGEHGLKAQGGSTRIDLALTAAFEQGADTIFVITDGVPWVYKFLEGKELEEHMKRVAQWRERKAQEEESLTDKDRERMRKAEAEEKQRKEEEDAKRLRKGLGPFVREGGGKGGPAPPRFSDEDVLKHVDMLQKKFYDDQGKRRARVHVIGYEVDGQTENFLRELATQNKGRFRRIKHF